MSSRRAERRRACERKLTYGTKEEAVTAAREILRVHGDKLNAYHCRFCGQHHLGHKPRRMREATATRRARRA